METPICLADIVDQVATFLDDRSAVAAVATRASEN
jgi:hypothetical protein